MTRDPGKRECITASLGQPSQGRVPEAVGFERLYLRVLQSLGMLRLGGALLDVAGQRVGREDPT